MRIQGAPHCRRQDVAQQHLAVGEGDGGEGVGRRERLLKHADHPEVVADVVRPGGGVLGRRGQSDRAAQAGVERLGRVRPQDHLAPPGLVQLAAARHRELEVFVALEARCGGAHEEAPAQGQAGVGVARHPDGGEGGCDTIHVLDHLRRAYLHQPPAEAVAGITDHDVVGEEAAAAVEQGGGLFGHGAHRGQRHHADHDAADREPVAELAPGQVADSLHCPQPS